VRQLTTIADKGSKGILPTDLSVKMRFTASSGAKYKS
jgi:hypothetical protein